MSVEPCRPVYASAHELVCLCVCVHEGVCMQVCTVLREVTGEVTSNATQASSPFLPLRAPQN